MLRVNFEYVRISSLYGTRNLFIFIVKMELNINICIQHLVAMN